MKRCSRWLGGHRRGNAINKVETKNKRDGRGIDHHRHGRCQLQDCITLACHQTRRILNTTTHPYRRGAASVPRAIPLINLTSLATAGTPRLDLAPTPPPAHRPPIDSRPIHTALHTRDHRRPAPPRCAVTVHTRTTTRWQVCSHHGHQLPRPAGHHHHRPAARPVR